MMQPVRTLDSSFKPMLISELIDDAEGVIYFTMLTHVLSGPKLAPRLACAGETWHHVLACTYQANVYQN